MRPALSRGLFVLVLGVGTFALLSVYADASTLGDRLGGVEWTAVLAAALLALVNHAVRFVRWSWFLATRGIAVRAWPSALVFLSGFAMAITPGRVGELIKCYLLRELNGTPVTRSAGIVVAERVIDLVALLVVAFAGLACYGVGGGVVVAGAIFVGVALGGVLWPAFGRAGIRILTAPRRLRRFRGRLDAFYDGLVELVRGRVLAATALSVVAWSAECLGFALVVAAFPAVDVPIPLAAMIYAITLIAGALSFLPGGLGVTETTMTVLLVRSGHGVDTATATAATMITRLATFWISVVLGVAALAAMRRRLRAAAPPAQIQP